jgi:hypothetical protein
MENSAGEEGLTHPLKWRAHKGLGMKRTGMRRWSRDWSLLIVAAVLWLAGQTAPSAAQIANNAAGNSAAANIAASQVYLLRGLMNIFSLGMDSLSDKLKAHGFQTTVSSWEFGGPIATEIAEKYQQGRAPVFVIGHSLGANTTFEIAKDLQGKNIPVRLIVTFDPTIPQPVPSNVAQFVNFFAKDGFGHRVQAGPGFTGELDNLDLSADGNITHGNIDALDRFHQFVIERMLEATAPASPHHPRKRH